MIGHSLDSHLVALNNLSFDRCRGSMSRWTPLSERRAELPSVEVGRLDSVPIDLLWIGSSNLGKPVLQFTVIPGKSSPWKELISYGLNLGAGRQKLAANSLSQVIAKVRGYPVFAFGVEAVARDENVERAPVDRPIPRIKSSDLTRHLKKTATTFQDLIRSRVCAELDLPGSRISKSN